MVPATPSRLARKLVAFTIDQVEAIQKAHLPGWRIPGTFGGHLVGADVRADLCYTLHHLAEAGVGEVAGQRIDDVLRTLLAQVDGPSTHTFFSYRIAEVLLRHGPFAGNPLLAGLSADQMEQVAQAVDSSDWLELLDAGVLPRNYAGVLSRCERGRVALGLVDDRARLDDLIGRVRAVLGGNPSGALDDSNDGIGRYDIYSADVWLFTEPLAAELGSLWDDGFARALELVLAVGRRDGTAVAWGRSSGDLGVALTLELATLALASGRAGDHAPTWVRRAADAADALDRAFDAQGVATAHVGRDQDAYRGPERRLQLTFDLLGKVAWAAGALARVPAAVADLPAADAAEAYPPQDRWIAFEEGRPAGAWAHRRPGLDVVVPFVGTTRSHYLPAPGDPGSFEVPVDRDLPTWTPLVIDRLRRFTAGGLPADLEVGPSGVRARWDGFEVSGRGLDGDDPGPPLAGSRTAELSVEGRSLVLRDHLTFERPPVAVGTAIAQAGGRALRVEWEVNGGQPSVIDVAGLKEWRSFWSDLPRVHQVDLDPATDVRYSARVTPELRVGSTAHGHHYDRPLYRALRSHGIEGRRSPIGWEASAEVGLRDVDLLHLHWPEWLAFDDLAAHQGLIAELRYHGVPVVWTAHNLTPHEKRAEVYDPIYQAWAEAVDAVIHHSAWGEEMMRDRYRFGPRCRHQVIPHGHFGAMWTKAGLPDRVEAERRLGLAPLPPGGLRIGVVGAPRAEKLVQVVLDGVAASTRADVELACWSLGRGESVPADGRIVVAEPYRSADAATYATRLAACDALALVFDPEGEMLATGTAADAIGVGLPVLRSDWGYLVEHLGPAGIDVGHSAVSIATALDGLAGDELARARAAATDRQAELDWPAIAAATAGLLERVVQDLP